MSEEVQAEIKEELAAADAVRPEKFEYAIRIRGLRNQFGDAIIHDNLDLDVRSGEILGVVGGSGTGKSVLMRSIVGLQTPVAGEIEVYGKTLDTIADEEESRDLRRRWGVMFQGGALFDSLSVWENIAFRLINADNVKRGEARERAIEVMRKVRLAPEFADVRPIELSGGMQKRAGLARAIIAKPDILFFDEPTTGLDPITADAINDLIVEMVKELGCAAVSITHDMVSARKIADAAPNLVELVEMPGGHCAPLEHPEAVNHHLRALVSAVLSERRISS